MTGRLPPKEETESMRWGRANEPGISARFAEKMDCDVVDPGDFTVFSNTDYPLIAVTPDRLIPTVNWGRENEWRPLELKTTTSWGAKFWNGQTPLWVQVQVQAQMLVLNAERGYVAANLANEDFRTDSIDRHEPFMNIMLAEVERFLWYVDHDRQPPVTDRDRYTLQELYPEHVPGEVVELSDSVMPYVERWLIDKDAKSALDAESRKLTTRMDGDKAQIIAAITEQNGKAELARLPDGRTLSWRTTHRKPQEASQFRTLRLVKGTA